MLNLFHQWPSRRFVWNRVGLALPVLFLAGCSQEPIRVYEAPKPETAPRVAARSEAGAGDAHGTTDAPGHLHWELPAGWEETSSSGVRTATFRVTGASGAQAEVAIMPFRKMGGGDLQFVNLWRTTLGLEEVEEAQLSDMVEEIQIGDVPAKLYDVMDEDAAGEAAPQARIIVAMAVQGDTSWFFKLAGDGELVTAQKDTFKEFLKTVSFHDADAHGDEVAAAAPPAEPVAASGGPAKPRWTVPDGWQEVPPTAMLLAKFTLSGPEGGQADVTVSVFPGDVGGLLANVNRWRSQVGQPPVGEADLANHLTALDVGGNPASLVDVSGTSLDTGVSNRLIGAIVPQGGRTWFFKLFGDSRVAAEQKEAFLQFVNSIQLPNA